MGESPTDTAAQDYWTRLDRIERRLRARFGRQVIREPASCRVRPLALPRDIEVRVNSSAPLAVVEVSTIVTDKLDWDAPGLRDVLLRENEALALGGFARRGGMLVIAHRLPVAAASAIALEQVVTAIAETLVEAVVLLGEVDALRT
jgi:hypothetical protein